MRTNRIPRTAATIILATLIATNVYAAAASVQQQQPPSGKVNVNTANETELARLPGIGPAIAGRIIEQRKVQPFKAVDDLLAVKGIGPKLLDRIRPYVTLTGQTTLTGKVKSPPRPRRKSS